MSPNPELAENGMSVLLDYAARGETLTYGDLNRNLGGPYKFGGNFPGQIGRLCDDINARHDALTGLPFMISALVHNGSTHLPGPGFFELAGSLELLPRNEDECAKRKFVDAQLDSIFAHYRPT
jgi:hypothetical protein